MSKENNPELIELEKVAFWKWLQEKNKSVNKDFEPIQLEIEIPPENPSTSSYMPNNTNIINYEIDHNVYSSGSFVYII